MPRQTRYTSFEEAVSEVLSFLQGRFGLELWMLTRVEQNDWIVLQTNRRGNEVLEGRVLRWADTLCRRMAAGEVAQITPDLSQVAAYADLPAAKGLKIGAYVGLPIFREDGQLFGTLCGMDTCPMPQTLTAEMPFLQTMGRLLSSLLSAELEGLEQARRLERSQMQANSDELTGLYNRRAWNQFLQSEGQRARSLGHPLAVLVVDLDDLKRINDSLGHQAGDALIVRASAALAEAVRGSDVLARVGGDEFAVLAIDCDPARVERLLERIRSALEKAQVSASVGSALHDLARDLRHTWHQADQSMYQHKQSRRAHPPKPRTAEV